MRIWIFGHCQGHEWHVYTCVCVYICIHTHTHAIYMCAYIHMYTHTYMRRYVYLTGATRSARFHVYIHVQIHNTYTHSCATSGIYIKRAKHTYVMPAHTSIYANIRRHTHKCDKHSLNKSCGLWTSHEQVTLNKHALNKSCGPHTAYIHTHMPTLHAYAHAYIRAYINRLLQEEKSAAARKEVEEMKKQLEQASKLRAVCTTIPVY